MAGSKIPRSSLVIHQSRTSSLRSLLRRLDETSDSRKFRYKIDVDWFERQYKMAGSKIPRSGRSFESWACATNRKSLFPDFKSDLSRVARFTAAGQEERKPWVRGWINPFLSIKATHAQCQPRPQASSCYPSERRRLGTERDSAKVSQASQASSLYKLCEWRHVKTRRERLGTRLAQCYANLYW